MQVEDEPAEVAQGDLVRGAQMARPPTRAAAQAPGGGGLRAAGRRCVIVRAVLAGPAALVADPRVAGRDRAALFSADRMAERVAIAWRELLSGEWARP